MVKRAVLEIGYTYNGLAINGDTPNGRKNYFKIPVRVDSDNIDFIFPCYYEGKVYIFYPSSGDLGYSVYDGSSFSDYIGIPESGNRKLLGAVSVRDGLVVFTKNVEENNLYQMIKFKNGEWLDFENINNLKLGYDNEQFCGVSVNGEARVLRAATNLQFIASSDNFQAPYNIIWDGSYIGTPGGTGCSISAEISSFDFIFCAPEQNGIAVYLQNDKTLVTRLGYIDVPQISTIQGASIYRISTDRFKIYIVGYSDSVRKAYSGEFNINNLGSGISEETADYSIRKYLSAWIIKS
ncbi:hypothetical protein [Acinetobacter bereziniae]|uniref:hypothetical protein n=1 Tax=Acinetobacter bereziniae TaxID=106648 RepID=UPI00124D9ABF|nr:hypothetical protein [Acinetobacter bereziniae]MBJ8444526.1 hypothetical protein [Acinetobacter bereziniae]